VEADYAEQMIVVNRRLHPDARITFLVGDAAELEIASDSLDGVICFAAFPHFDDKLRCLRNLQRLLKPAGWLAIAHFLSSAEIAAHHGKTEVVMRDTMPDHATMRSLFQQAGLRLERLTDRGGFYLALGFKQ
jgi:ubiquinone/menaquinone biosynthesis C-methylase UbiE